MENPDSDLDLAERIRQLMGWDFHDPLIVETFEREIGALEDDDARDRARYAFAERLISEWVLDAAERATRLMEIWRIEKTWLFGDLALKWAFLGQRAHALELLQEAVGIARTAGSAAQQAEALARIARRFNDLAETDTAYDVFSEAVAIASALAHSGDIDTSSVLWELAEDLCLLGKWDLARQVVEAITHPGKRQRALTRIEKMHSLARMPGDFAGQNHHLSPGVE